MFAGEEVQGLDTKFQQSYSHQFNTTNISLIHSGTLSVEDHQAYVNNIMNTFERIVRVVVEILEAYPLAEMFFNLSVGNWSYFIDVAIFTYAKLMQFEFGIVQVILDIFIRLFWEFFSQGFVYQVESGMIVTESQLVEGSFLKKLTFSNIVFFDMIHSWNHFIANENIDISLWEAEEKFRHFIEFTFWNQQYRLTESVTQ